MNHVEQEASERQRSTEVRPRPRRSRAKGSAEPPPLQEAPLRIQEVAEEVNR